MAATGGDACAGGYERIIYRRFTIRVRARSLISDSGRDSQIARTMRVLGRDSDGGEAWREPTARICVIA